MEKQYTNFFLVRDNVLYRGVEDGERVLKRIPYKPSLFVESKSDTKWKTLFGQSVDKITFNSIGDARDFVRRYENVDNFNYYGNTKFHYAFISDQFEGLIDYNMSNIVVVNIDIEVGSDMGFAKPDNPFEQIIAITMEIGGQYISFGCGEFFPSVEHVKYIRCSNESELLTKFIEHWVHISPDIVTGWNVQFYDIPYLYNRIERVLGETDAKKLSPWKMINKKEIMYGNRPQLEIELCGISTLDYMDLYIRYQPKKESNKLNYISYAELGEKKISYEEYGNLYNLYKSNFQLFMEYNIKDVELVKRLEEKLKLIEMVVALAYDAKVNFNDVFTQVRLWDTIIFNHLKANKIVMPKIVRNNKATNYAGAYVKEIEPCSKDWVVSFDLNSLYPSLIAQMNISPECLVPELYDSVSVESILDMKHDTKKYKDVNVSLAVNGHCFTNDKVGFLPDILMRMYEDRKLYKNKMISAKRELERVNEELKRRAI
ncbi:MAG: 3'-5' exonuclease [Bacteroidota bacterium]|jgi:DNA polymerase elongation subunit (family B)